MQCHRTSAVASALSNRQNCTCARKSLQTQGRTHGAGCVQQWFRTAEPLGERRYENWNTHKHRVVVINDFAYLTSPLWE